jgi:DNA-binding CsgD family transcriptional regulator
MEIDSGHPEPPNCMAMTSLAVENISFETTAAKPATRGDLTTFLMEQTDAVSADAYMLVAVVHDQDHSDARIIASNWIYDAIQLAGQKLIATLAQSSFAAAPGGMPRAIVTAAAPSLEGIGGEDVKLLDVLGHSEIYALKLFVGRQRLFLLFSAASIARIDLAALIQTQFQCCYGLSRMSEVLGAAVMQDPLSDRERECLFWVSEGKTTDEVAVILGVSSNTVNSYITHAIRKFSASNRAMAVATAIRSGII